MNVLLLSTESNVQYVFIRPIAEHLRKQGHTVVLACSDEPGEFGQSFVEPLRRLGFEVLVVPIKRAISPWADLCALAALYRHMRRRRFDVVHVQTAKAGMLGRIAARLAGVPVVIYTVYAFPFHDYLSRRRFRLYVLLERIAARLCDVMVGDSESVRARGLKFRVTSPDRIRVIHMGVDTDRFDAGKYRGERAAIRTELGLQSGAVVVGAVARMVPDKGLDCFLRAMALIAKRHADVQGLLIGGGPLRGELEELRRSLNLDGRVVFAGHCTDVPRVLSAMDVFMLPTRREGFGVAFAEAMSMGVPVVGSRIAPLAEIIEEGRTGCMAGVDAPEEFARAVCELLDRPERRRSMGDTGRRHVVEKLSPLSGKQ